jgi:PKD repeat protein
MRIFRQSITLLFMLVAGGGWSDTSLSAIRELYDVPVPPAHGTLAGSAPNLTYTPTTNYYGADSFTFQASDGALDSTPATVALTVSAVNDEPSATATATPTRGQAPLAVSFLATGADLDGDALAYLWTFGDGATATEQNPGHTYASAGFYTATVTVSDGHGGSSSAQVEVTSSAPYLQPPVITPNGGSFDQPLSVSITPATMTVLPTTPGWKTGVKYPGDGIEVAEALSQDGQTVFAMCARTTAERMYMFPGVSLSPDRGPLPFYIWSLSDDNGPANQFMVYQPSLFAGVTEFTAWDGNNFDFYYGETGNRVFLLLEQHYRHAISLWSCAAGTYQGDKASQKLAEIPLPSVVPFAGTPLRMEFAGNQVRVLAGSQPQVSVNTDDEGWVTYTGDAASGRVTAPLGDTRFWITLAGGEKPGKRSLVVSDQPQVRTRFTYDGSPVTESSREVTDKLTLTHDITLRARRFSAVGLQSAETVATFDSHLPLLPAESYVSPAYMELFHATLDGSPAQVSLRV